MRTFTTTAGTLAAVTLALGMGSAQAALWNFTLSGTVTYSGESNAFNLVEGSPVTVTGSFDDSALIAGSGIVSFASENPDGNTLTVNMGDISFTPDEGFFSVPELTLAAMDVDFVSSGFIFAATDSATDASFNSYFGGFDGDDINRGHVSGTWLSFTATTTAVPVPAAAWLLGSGLLGLVGLARRKRIA